MKCFYLIIGFLAFIRDGECNQTSEDTGTKLTTCPCGWTNKPLTRNAGVETGINEFPMMAGIYYKPKKTLFCGAAIITEYHVLTAAHCSEMLDKKYDLTKAHVRVGEHDLSTKDETSATLFIGILDYKIHPDYDRKKKFNDISIINLKRKIPFSKEVGPVCIPNGDIDLVRKKLKILGWGPNQEKLASNVLMAVNLDVIPSTACTTNYRWMLEVKGRFFCTYHHMKESCQSDSGGPVLHLDKETNRYVLAGAISFGVQCPRRKPGVNTNISYYVPWIKEVIAETRPDAVMCYKQE